ncbi:MAG: PepSY domain-containing protein [Gammaproteobacteria bacterium]
MHMASLVLFGALALMAVPAQSLAASSHGAKQAITAKITMTQVQKIVLKAFSGKILHQELEREKAGSGLRYSFDIKQGNIVHEVGVDAMTGKVLENDVDSD